MKRRLLVLALLVVLPAALAFGRSSQAAAQAQPAAAVSHVIVYWGNMYTPYDPNNPFGLAPVLMFTDRADVATYTLEQYFKGPSPDIAAAGFVPDIDPGPIIDGKVFTLALDSGVANDRVPERQIAAHRAGKERDLLIDEGDVAGKESGIDRFALDAVKKHFSRPGREQP